MASDTNVTEGFPTKGELTMSPMPGGGGYSPPKSTGRRSMGRKVEAISI